MKIAAVIVAAGSGERLRSPKPKAFVPLGKSPLFEHSLSIFKRHSKISKIVLVFPPGYESLDLDASVVAGGARRQDSVAVGLSLLDDSFEAVLIHDAARPFVTSSIIDRLLAALKEGKHAIAAVKVTDTIKQGEGGRIIKTVDREALWAAQTPQAFLLGPLKDALNQAKRNGWLFTDEAALLEKLNIPVSLVEGDTFNFKITTPADLELAKAFFEWKQKKT